MKVLSYNVWGLFDFNFVTLTPFRKRRMQKIREHFARVVHRDEGWDILLLQELWEKEDRLALRNCGYPYWVDGDRGELWDASGTFILSRYPILNSYRRRYPNSPLLGFDGEALVRKSALFALIQVPEIGLVWCVNTHLVANYGGRDRYFKTRMRQLQLLSDWVSELDPNVPLILGGDLNFSRSHPEWAVFKNLFPTLVQASDDCVLPRNSHHKKDPGKIDFLLSNRWLEPRGGKATMTELVDIAGRPMHLSDHFGWEAEFSAVSFVVPGDGRIDFNRPGFDPALQYMNV